MTGPTDPAHAMDTLLEARLREARAHVDAQPARDLRVAVRSVIESDVQASTGLRGRFGRSLVLGVAAVLLIGATVATAFGVRHLFLSTAAGDGVPIDTGLPVGSGWDLGNEVTFEGVRNEAEGWLVAPPSLGAPDHVFLRQIRDVSLVSLVYEPRPGFPQARQGGPGLLLVEIGGAFENVTLEKIVPEGGTIQQVDLDGVAAHWITGRFHQFEIDDGGQLLLHVVAGETLVWEFSGATYRLETRAGRDATVALGIEIVRTLRAVDRPAPP